MKRKRVSWIAAHGETRGQLNQAYGKVASPENCQKEAGPRLTIYSRRDKSELYTYIKWALQDDRQ